MVFLAYVVETYGDRYLPIFQRLHEEYQAALKREEMKDLAKRVLEDAVREGWTRDGRKV